MGDEILINATPVQTRVALGESGVLAEIYVERRSHTGLVGNIYVGKVMRVLPGMQAAFVDIGLERASFLHVSDLVTPGCHRHDPETGRSGPRDRRDLLGSPKPPRRQARKRRQPGFPLTAYFPKKSRVGIGRI